MSRFATNFSRVAAVSLLRWFGVDVEYEDDSLGSPITINAKLTREKQERRKDSMGGWSLVTTRSARFRTADVATTILVSGTVTIVDVDGTTELFYCIENVNQVEGGMTQLNLMRSDMVEIARQNYRGR